MNLLVEALEGVTCSYVLWRGLGAVEFEIVCGVFESILGQNTEATGVLFSSILDDPVGQRATSLCRTITRY